MKQSLCIFLVLVLLAAQLAVSFHVPHAHADEAHHDGPVDCASCDFWLSAHATDTPIVSTLPPHLPFVTLASAVSKPFAFSVVAAAYTSRAPPSTL